MKIILPSKNEELHFVPLQLEHFDQVLENRFSEYNSNTTLEELLSKPRYQQLSSLIRANAGYGNYLKTSAAEFLLHLKNTGDDFYKKFLNLYGDESYQKFRISRQSPLRSKNYKGLYWFLLKDQPVYLGRCTDWFNRRISNGYGQISPKKCYTDGNSTNCRINSLIYKNRHINIACKVYCMDNIKDIVDYESELLKTYPEYTIWNIQGS